MPLPGSPCVQLLPATLLLLAVPLTGAKDTTLPSNRRESEGETVLFDRVDRHAATVTSRNNRASPPHINNNDGTIIVTTSKSLRREKRSPESSNTNSKTMKKDKKKPKKPKNKKNTTDDDDDDNDESGVGRGITLPISLAFGLVVLVGGLQI